MKVVLLGRESIDELTGLAKKYFSAVPNRPYKAQVLGTAGGAFPYTPEHTYLSRQVFIQPIQQIHLLTMYFPITSTTLQYRENPTRYLSFLLGDESQGSLLHYFKAQSWATAVSAGLTEDEAVLNVYQVQIRLTEEGVFHYQDIVTAVFSYIALIQQQGISETRWQEQQQIQLLAYTYQDKQVSTEYTSTLSARLLSIPMQDVLLPPQRNVYDEGLLHRIVQELTIENVLIHLASSTFSDTIFTQQEPVYKTRYTDVVIAPSFKDLLKRHVEKQQQRMRGGEGGIEQTVRDPHLPPHAVRPPAPVPVPASAASASESKEEETSSSSSLSIELSLPPPNPFLVDPSALSYQTSQVHSYTPDPSGPPSSASTPTTPVLIRHTATQSIYYHHNLSFQQPKVNLYFNILLSPSIRAYPITYTMQNVWKALVDVSLEPIAYAASLAGFSYDLTVLTTGFQLKISGYTQKIQTFAQAVVQQVLQPTSVGMDNDDDDSSIQSSSLFALTIRQFVEDLMNFRSSLAYEQAVYQLLQWVTKPTVSKDSMISIASGLVQKNFTHWAQTLYRNVMLEAYGYGDVNHHLMLQIVDSVWRENDHDSPITMTSVLRSRQQEQSAEDVVDVTSQKYQRKHRDSLQIPVGTWLAYASILNPADANSAVLVHLPTAAYNNLTASVYTDVLAFLIRQPCFDVLRTQQQLGYIAMCFPLTYSPASYAYRSINAIVQGVDHTAMEIQQRILTFFHTFAQTIIEWSADEWTQKRDSIVLDKRKILTTMTAMSDREWSEILSDALLFDRVEQEVAIVQSMTQQKLYEWYNRVIMGSNTHRQLTIEIIHTDVEKDMEKGDQQVLLSVQEREQIKATWPYWR